MEEGVEDRSVIPEQALHRGGNGLNAEKDGQRGHDPAQSSRQTEDPPGKGNTEHEGPRQEGPQQDHRSEEIKAFSENRGLQRHEESGGVGPLPGQVEVHHRVPGTPESAEETPALRKTLVRPVAVGEIVSAGEGIGAQRKHRHQAQSQGDQQQDQQKPV